MNYLKFLGFALLLPFFSQAQFVPITNEIIANETSSSVDKYPQVKMGNVGNILIAWRSDKSIWGQLFSRSGNKLGTNFKLNSGSAYSMNLACDSSGNFIVTWDDSSDVYVQLVENSGLKIGNPFKVNSTKDVCSYPSISMNKKGQFALSWIILDNITSQQSVKFRQYVNGINSPSTELTVYTKTNTGFIWNTEIFYNKSGNAYLKWMESSYWRNPIVKSGTMIINGKVTGNAPCLGEDLASSDTTLVTVRVNYQSPAPNIAQGISAIECYGSQNKISYSENLNVTNTMYEISYPKININVSEQYVITFSAFAVLFNKTDQRSIIAGLIDSQNNLIGNFSPLVVTPNITNSSTQFEDSLYVVAWLKDKNAALKLYRVLPIVTSLDADNSNYIKPVYPNPFDQKIEIAKNEQIANIEIYNTFGNLMISTNQHLIETSQLTPGIYTAIIKYHNGTSKQQKLLKY